MRILLRKFFTLFLITLLFLPLGFNKTEAISTNLNKTVEILIAQDTNVRTTNLQFPLSMPLTVNIPEMGVTIKSAIIEVSGVSHNSTGDQTITADLQPGGASKNYTLSGGADKPGFFSFKYDATSVINILNPNYTFNLTGIAASGTYSFSLFSAKLVLTYEYSITSSNLLNEMTFFVGQEQNKSISPVSINKSFTVSIPESSPEIKSVFLEISGSAKGTGVKTFQVGIAEGSGEIYDNTYSLDLNLGTSANISKFILRHDALPKIIFNSPDAKNYTLYFKSNDFDISLWSAKAIVTYKYSSGGMPEKGELVSSIFDTGAIKGAAFNSILWRGTPNEGKVRFQLAASDNISGPWEASDFKGTDCTSGSYYDAASDTPAEITCASHNNKRYFRYKVIICSKDCTNKGFSTPEVSDVIVNWVP